MSEWRKQVRLAQFWLHGYFQTEANGLEQRRFLSDGGLPEMGFLEDDGTITDLPKVDDKVCREALAALLRDGNPPRNVLTELAALIAPNDDKRAAGRRLDFRWRKRGNGPQHRARTQIATAIRHKVMEGGRVEEGVQIAVERYGISPGYAYRCWRDYKPLFAAIDRDILERTPDILEHLARREAHEELK